MIKYHYIFGLRTSDADKREIIEIIINKCKQEHRKEFKFYQTFYNKETCSIDYREDTLINNLLLEYVSKK